MLAWWEIPRLSIQRPWVRIPTVIKFFNSKKYVCFIRILQTSTECESAEGLIVMTPPLEDRGFESGYFFYSKHLHKLFNNIRFSTMPISYSYWIRRYHFQRSRRQGSNILSLNLVESRWMSLNLVELGRSLRLGSIKSDKISTWASLSLICVRT